MWQQYLWNIAIQLAVGCSAYKLIYFVWVLTAREKNNCETGLLHVLHVSRWPVTLVVKSGNTYLNTKAGCRNCLFFFFFFSQLTDSTQIV